MIASIDEGGREPFSVACGRRGPNLEVTFCTIDQPARLSQLCGVLTVNDLNIVYARVFTRTDGRVIDVSFRAAEDLDMVQAGLVRCRVEVLSD